VQSDRDLISLFLARRSESAFAAIYERHRAVVYGLAVRLGGATAADDIAQDAWVRAVHAFGRFNGHSSLRTWLCGIVVNCCRERWRREGAPAEDYCDVSVTSDPGTAVDVRDAIDRLSPGYRSVLVLHDIYGHTHGEIARMLDIEEGTSKSQLARARAAMRTLLKGHSNVE
jgi:RNA polymerase sigma-70 factor (ECF subfamily)